MIGVPVRHDYQRELSIRCGKHVFDGIHNGADVAGARGSFEHSAIDQDELIAIRSGHSDQEEVAKPNAIHAHPEAAALRRSHSSFSLLR